MSMLEIVVLVILLWTVASVLFGLVAGQFFALTWEPDGGELRAANAQAENEANNSDAPPLSATTVSRCMTDVTCIAKKAGRYSRRAA